MWIRDFPQILEVLAARPDAKLPTAPHANYDLAAHLWYAGDEELPDPVFQFTEIVTEQFLSRVCT